MSGSLKDGLDMMGETGISPSNIMVTTLNDVEKDRKEIEQKIKDINKAIRVHLDSIAIL